MSAPKSEWRILKQTKTTVTWSRMEGFRRVVIKCYSKGLIKVIFEQLEPNESTSEQQHSILTRARVLANMWLEEEQDAVN